LEKKRISKNFNIFENNIINVKLAKVLGYLFEDYDGEVKWSGTCVTRPFFSIVGYKQPLQLIE
jgi:hypothetical protein